MYKIYINGADRFKKSVKLTKTENQMEKEIAMIEGNIDITATVEKLLKENNVKIDDIKEVIPNKGPGSFTGIKIVLAVSNTLNWALGHKKIDELDQPNYGKEPNISTPNKK